MGSSVPPLTPSVWMEVCACLWSVTGHHPSGESAAADGSTDPSELGVSLTLNNKFEGRGTDAGDISAQSLLLRWVAAALAPAALAPRPAEGPAPKQPPPSPRAILSFGKFPLAAIPAGPLLATSASDLCHS